METRTKGDEGPIESNTGPPMPLKSSAPRPMKNVRRIVMAPRTSLGKFFMKSDSMLTTIIVEQASSIHALK